MRVGRSAALVAIVVMASLGAAACSSTSGPSGTSSGSTAPAGTTGAGSASATSGGAGSATTGTGAGAKLRVLVTNDDGVKAPGLDALVEGLRKLPDTEVIVVAPAENQSGTGGKTTSGPLTVTDSTTASGYPAKAVQGYPADTILWAFGGGISQRPNVVMSGVNNGQNLGAVTKASGTVGAANQSALLGVPALATSQGVAAPPAQPEFASGTALALDWLAKNRPTLLATPTGPPGTAPATPAALLVNLNVPNCPAGKTRGVVEVPVATTAQDALKAEVDCASTATNPTDDIQAFNEGFAPQSTLAAAPPAG